MAEEKYVYIDKYSLCENKKTDPLHLMTYKTTTLLSIFYIICCGCVLVVYGVWINVPLPGTSTSHRLQELTVLG